MILKTIPKILLSLLQYYETLHSELINEKYIVSVFVNVTETEIMIYQLV